MRLRLLSCAFWLLWLNSYSQKFELSINGGANISHYNGSSSAANSYIIESYTSVYENYTANPYGKKYGLGFDTNIQLQYVSKSNFIAGLSSGFQSLTSNVHINNVQPAVFYAVPFIYYFGPVLYSANGITKLHSTFINISPYIGYRIRLKRISIDILPGLDVAFLQNIHEKGNAEAYSQNYSTNVEINEKLTDVRIKLGAAVNYKKFSINAGYAYGLGNYKTYTVNLIAPAAAVTPSNNNDKVNSELFRLGIGYRIL